MTTILDTLKNTADEEKAATALAAFVRENPEALETIIKANQLFLEKFAPSGGENLYNAYRETARAYKKKNLIQSNYPYDSQNYAEAAAYYLKAAEEWGVLPMFYLELSTGLRRGELVALLWSDLNLQTKTLTVSKSVSRGKGELVVTEPKTENSVREIYLSDEAIRLLVEDRKNHPFSPYMFPSPKTGGMYGPDCVGRIHKKLLEKAGIEEHVRFHDLRHTFSTLAIQSGIDPKTVAEILGHASAEFSLDVYTHVTAGMKKEAAQKISGFMASVG